MGAGRAFVDLAQGLTDAGCAVYAFDRVGHGESDGRFLDVTVPNELEQLSKNATLYRYAKADHGWNRLADRTLLLQRSVADIAGLAEASRA